MTALHPLNKLLISTGLGSADESRWFRESCTIQSLNTDQLKTKCWFEQESTMILLYIQKGPTHTNQGIKNT